MKGQRCNPEVSEGSEVRIGASITNVREVDRAFEVKSSTCPQGKDIIPSQTALNGTEFSSTIRNVPVPETGGLCPPEKMIDPMENVPEMFPRRFKVSASVPSATLEIIIFPLSGKVKVKLLVSPRKTICEGVTSFPRDEKLISRAQALPVQIRAMPSRHISENRIFFRIFPPYSLEIRVIVGLTFFTLGQGYC